MQGIVSSTQFRKVQAEMLKNHVVVYSDTTIAAPIVFAYALATRKKRKPKRLFQRLPALFDALRAAHMQKHPGSDALPEMRETGKATRSKAKAKAGRRPGPARPRR